MKIEPIGIGSRKWWWIGPHHPAWRAACFHDAAYELRKHGYLWHDSSKDADEYFLVLFDEAISSKPFWKRSFYKAEKLVFARIIKWWGKSNWPGDAPQSKPQWALVQSFLSEWWDRAAPEGATTDHMLQMIADVKFRYWRHA